MAQVDAKIRPQGSYVLQYSATADRANPVDLDGATLNTDVYVFVTPTTGIDSVLFHYNNANQRTDSAAPFDLVGESGANALPINMASTIGAGDQTVTAAVASGSNVYTISATFTASALSVSSPPDTVRSVSAVPTPAILVSGANSTVTPSAVAATSSIGGTPLDFAGPNTVGTTVFDHSLTTISGNYSMSQNQSLADKYITGNLTCQINTTVSNVWVRAYTDLASGGGTIEYSDLGPNSNPESLGLTDDQMRRSVAFDRATLNRCDIRGMVDGTFIGSTTGNITFNDCWFHGQFKRASDPDQGGGASHCDCVQIGRGTGRYFNRCRFDMIPWEAGETFDQWNNGAWPLPGSAYNNSGQPRGTQCIIVRPVASTNTIDTVQFDSCRISGYTNGHLIYLGKNGTAKPTNVSFTNNVIDVRGINTARKVLGVDSGVANPTWTNNTLAANFTGPSSGTVYTAGSTISLSLAKTVLSSW